MWSYHQPSGHLVGAPNPLATATTPPHSYLGQSGRTLEFLDGRLAVRARRDAAVHTFERNMAESVQRILCGRALNGQHPQSSKEIITWLEDTVAGWNAAPTPFVWDGKRRERRLRAKRRRLGGSAAILADHQLIAA